MRAELKEYQAVEEAAMKFVKRETVNMRKSCLPMKRFCLAIWMENWSMVRLSSFIIM